MMAWPNRDDPDYQEKTAAYYARQKARMEDPEYRAKVYARRKASQDKLKAKRAENPRQGKRTKDNAE